MNVTGTYRRLAGVFGALLATAGTAWAGTVAVGDFTGNRVVMVDAINGTFRGTIANGGGLVNPFGFAYGPDGMLYVSSNGTGQIKRYNELGQFVDNWQTTPRPHGLAFFERDLVVANGNTGRITRFGLIAWSSAPRQGRIYQSVVIRNGRLFVGFNSPAGGGIEEFDPASGASRGDFMPTGRGLWDVQGFGWGPDGNLYITSSNNQRILRMNDQGQSLGFFSTPGQPLGLRFNANGELLSTIWANTQVARMSVPGFTHLGGLLPGTVTLQQPWYIELVNPTIDGQISFSGRTNPAPPVTTLTIEFAWPGSAVTIQSRTATLQSNGRFSVLAPSFLNEYDMRIKVGTFLTQTRRVDTRDATRVNPSYTLTNGDVDGNDTIDTADYRILNRTIGRSTGQSGWDARADLNGDGVVNSLDMTVLVSSYGLTGRGQ